MTSNLHDIRNFAGAIVGSLSLAQASDLPADKRATLIANALRSAVDLKASVDDRVSRTRGEHPRRRVTDEPTAMRDLNDVQGLFLAAIEKTRMPMIVTDPHRADNPIIFANEAFVRTTGYDLNEIIGHNCRFLQGKDTDRGTVDEIRTALEKQSDISVEILNYRKDGSAFWNALFMSPIFDADGRLLYFFGSQLDITRRREAEQALRKSQKLEAIGQLTGGIAHDFNNLLQVVLGNLVLARQTSDYEKSERHLETVFQAATKARVLTQQLLAFSRKQPLAARIANLNRVVLDTRDMLSETLGDHVQIETRLDKGIGNVEIDTVQLEMALVNILVNARDAMPDGGKAVISTGTWTHVAGSPPLDLAPGDYVKLAIADTGTGMTADILAHATEPFFTTKDVGKGTGLGLAQVYGFAKQSQGHVTLDSKPGEGTRVTLYFPLVAAEASAIQPAAAVTGAEGRGERILIVEDNKEIQVLAQTILDHEGYATEIADNAEEALDRVAQATEPFMLIFSDIMMPGGMNGIALVRQLQATHPECTVLLTTGYTEETSDDPDTQQFETIYKPYLPQELSRKVRDVLNRRKDHKT